MIIKALEQLGPSLSTKLSEYLVTYNGLSADAARQRVSRAPSQVKRLNHLPFQRNSRFMYLQKDFASPQYWDSLFSAINSTGGAYARALGAVQAREVVPLEHFKVCCGAPIAQKKHISANTVLKRMLAADVLVIKTIAGLGECVLTKQYFESETKKKRNLGAQARARIVAEGALLESIKEWLRKLAFASYNSIRYRTGTQEPPPQVGTYAWDLTGPSYISGLTTWNKDTQKPGFIVCDLLLNRVVAKEHILPFLYKVRSCQALRNLGRAMFFFIAHNYEQDAFNELRAAGVVPASPESLFGQEIGKAFFELIGTLTKAANGILDPTKFDELFSKLSKLEGAVGNIRGTFFEYLVAEIIRKTSPAQVQLNKFCEGEDGSAEVDVWEVKEGVIARMIECKGIAPGKLIDDEQIGQWLTKRIPRVRQYLERQRWRGPKPRFELWTTGVLSTSAQERIERTKEANAQKFELKVLGPEAIWAEAKAVNDAPLLNALERHFIPAAGSQVQVGSEQNSGNTKR